MFSRHLADDFRAAAELPRESDDRFVVTFRVLYCKTAREWLKVRDRAFQLAVDAASGTGGRGRHVGGHRAFCNRVVDEYAAATGRRAPNASSAILQESA